MENFYSLFPKNSPMQFAKSICKEFLLQVENQTVEKSKKSRKNEGKTLWFFTFPQPIVFCFSKSVQRLCKGLFLSLSTAFPNLTKRFSNHFSTGVENLVEKQKNILFGSPHPPQKHPPLAVALTVPLPLRGEGKQSGSLQIEILFICCV